jgi:mono/diheme cytochrome c family protein
MRLSLCVGAVICGALVTGAALAEGGRGESGQQVYKQANCVGCHKWSGVGGGGYGGAALSLRKTELSVDQIVEIVTCGRPGTGMPHFTSDPYGARGCYGLTAGDVKDMMPPAANVVLRPQEIEDVARYVVDDIKGKGEPMLADCTAFFGDASRACDLYRPQTAAAASHHVMPTPTTTR